MKISRNLFKVKPWMAGGNELVAIAAEINNEKAWKQRRVKRRIGKEIFHCKCDCWCKYLTKWIPSIIICHESSIIRKGKYFTNHMSSGVFIIFSSRESFRETHPGDPPVKEEWEVKLSLKRWKLNVCHLSCVTMVSWNVEEFFLPFVTETHKRIICQGGFYLHLSWSERCEATQSSERLGDKRNEK